jgi:cyclopropane fatty-acyl-phospholipid synthase-like methyltransferase
MRQATFNPDAYRVANLNQAKHMTLGEVGTTDGETHTRSEKRWVEETEYTLDFILDRFPNTRHTTAVLDYGCGTGRMSKALIEARGCGVLGVDASVSMRTIASRHVRRREFRTCEPQSLLSLENQFDYAICLWVLQHSGQPTDDALLLHTALKPGGRLLVMNELIRFVPTIEMGFVNDGIDICKPLEDHFGCPVDGGKLDAQRVHPKFAARTFWAEYKKQ